MRRVGGVCKGRGYGVRGIGGFGLDSVGLDSSQKSRRQRRKFSSGVADELGTAADRSTDRNPNEIFIFSSPIRATLFLIL